jgi:hypothetical protein
MHGASRQAAQKWRAKGALVMNGNKVELESSDMRMRAAGLGRFKSGAGKSVAPSIVDGIDAAEDSDTLEERLLAGNVLTKVQAEGIKESALALKHLVAVRKEAGQLLEAEAVERVVFEEAQKARDAWLNFPSKVAPLLAADLGVDAGLIAEALTAHVHKQLESLGEPAFDFGAGED